ncbi:glycosyltransferase [Proteus mirabilis]|uniref:glycosyltransferase family 2 protein n=1 Tax=Proteus mirabilis TaxID=584 RepID=UPI0016274207|nr:glycosyltransferase [Proteus mirabilis]MBB6663355.1 glycosyltransferase [Proteus mirabilis]MBB6706781.1 glycosyltransferase [Proteus mirabilis]MBB6728897.1 glycosyltransferase [Proteus mirabilis]MBS3845416.1 glycosyltransferase [Proteus mirabilis]
MKITIIIACYNSEKYIIETLDSCINQSYKNIQIIITDDCSQDNSVSVINEWLNLRKKTHPDIECILVENKSNNGIPSNCNAGLKYASGDWIKFLGSDDILHIDAVSNFINLINSDPNKKLLGVVFTYFETFGNSVISQKYPLAWTRLISSMPPSILKKKLSNLQFNNLAPGAFIQKKFINFFDTKYRLLEDLPFWLTLIENDVKTDFYNFISVYYRIHSNQVTSANSKMNNILYNDLVILNKRRLINYHFIGYFHNKFNLFCDKHKLKYIKILNPVNIIIKIIDKVF